MTLSYTIPKKFLTNTGVTAISVSGVARNPITILSNQNKGVANPEFSNQGGNGVGLSTVVNYPNTRTYGLNMNPAF
jgi:hypothetical protein